MTQDPLARMTDLLRGAVAEGADVAAMPDGRDQAIAKLAVALRERAERNKRRRVYGTLAVAAGVMALVGGGVVASRMHASDGVASNQLGRVRDPDVTAMRDGHAQTLGAGTRVAEGTELRTAQGGEAHLDFDTGTQVTIQSAARVRLVEQSKSKRFALEAGSIVAKVAKLGEGERFVVATPDAEIEVRGTQFRVSLVAGDASCEGGTPTRLDVTEGTVVVRHAGAETRVTAGQHWPSCPARGRVPIATAPTPTAPETMAAAPTLPNVAPVPLPLQPAAAAAASSRLAEQNDMFEQAMRAKRDGRSAQALAGFDKLLTQYPSSPLAEGASVERMRILAASDRARGAAAAREYLKRWPRGTARAEAEGLVAGTP